MLNFVVVSWIFLHSPGQSVYQQQFTKLTACIRLSASSKHICLLYVLMTDYPFLYILETFVMHFCLVPGVYPLTYSGATVRE